MESKYKDPGKRMLQLAVREAISSKLSLSSSFKREFDKKKQCRYKISEKKEVPKESLVTKEMAEIFQSIEKSKKKTLRSIPEKNSSESLINENANEEFYIPPPHYPNNFLMSRNPNNFLENTTSSLFRDAKKNHLSTTSLGNFEQHFPHLPNPENKKHCLQLSSLPNLVSSGTDSPKDLQNCQNLIWESKKNSNNVSRSKPLSPKKNEENDYIYNLIDSLTSKKATEKNIENGILREQPINKTLKAKDAEFQISSSSSSLDKSLFNSQGPCDVQTKYLNFKRNLLKQENIVEQENANLTEKIDTMLSSQNEVSVAVLCEFFKLHALLN